MGNTWSIPASIGTTCPHCTSVVIFTMIEDGLDNNHRAYLCSGICPSCVEKSEFIFLAPKIRDDVNPKTTEIYITPTPTDWHQTIEFTENISSALRRAYESTVDSFNSKNYVATAVGCRRTLEGIFKNLVQDDKKSLTLSKMIDEVKDSVDLAAPLTKLSHAIRAGGNRRHSQISICQRRNRRPDPWCFTVRKHRRHDS